MNEQEIIAKQEESGNALLYLMKMGMFFHAYGAAAYALSHVHYRVIEKLRCHGVKLVTAGFPVSRLSHVIEKIKEVGGKVNVVSDNIVEFSDVDTSMVKAEHQLGVENILKIIRDYDLSNSTPLGAINFIARLQETLKKQ
jgi:DNA mismatch repair ATPase MutS